MKKLSLFPILIGLVLIYSFASSSKIFNLTPSGKVPAKLPKEITVFTGEMNYVPSGTFISELYIGDSAYYPSRQVSVQAFYMSQTEVTNNQYRAFYKDMVKLFGKDSAAFYIPDTTSFTRDLPYAYVEPMKENYFSHAAYDNYPVIGVNWFQAQGYCKWIDNKLAELYKEHSDWEEKYAMNQIRIPTEMEWEYAAKGIGSAETRTPLYSWGNYLMHADKGNVVWNGNFGRIKDESGVTVKTYVDDNAFFMAEANSYSPNFFGLFNMSGNVSEWVEDTYVEDPADNDMNLFRDDSIVKVNIRRLTKKEIEHVNVNKVIKGGSYLDAPAWCLIGNRRPMAADSARCDVGFRICSTMFYSKEKTNRK